MRKSLRYLPERKRGELARIVTIIRDSAPRAERGKFFDDLRKNYPVRREFQNTEIIMNVENKSLAKKLIGIGFTQTDQR